MSTGAPEGGDSSEDGRRVEAQLVNRTLRLLRPLCAVAAVGALLGAVLMFVVGSVSTVEAFRTYLDHDRGEGGEDRGLAATVELVGALDEYLFGLLLFVFAAGICQLFLLDGRRPPRALTGVPRWLHIVDLLQLKVMLVELTIVVLIVQFFRVVLAEVEELEWTLLTLPIAVGIFALVLAVLRSGIPREPTR
jgi:uncharacterized membrane protein YqhA